MSFSKKVSFNNYRSVMAQDGVDTMSAFQANMRALLAQGTCSDVTLQVGGDTTSAVQEVTLIKAHSNVLCAHSPVFALELASTWKERVTASANGVATVADVKVPYSLSATKVALDFCYSGAVEIPAGDVVEVLDLSRHYKISVLADAAAAIIKEQMNATNVCIFYSNAVQFNHQQLSAECATFCEKNLDKILAEDTFNALPEVVVKQLVSSDNSNAEEIAIFKALVAWGKALYGDAESGAEQNGAAATPAAAGEEPAPEPAAEAAAAAVPASPAAHPDVLAARTPTQAVTKLSLRERLAPLLEHVRFPLIEGKALAEHVEPTGLVSDHLLFEAYRYHASGVAQEGCPRFVPRKGTGVTIAAPAPAATPGAAPVPAAAPAPVAPPDPTSLWELSLPNGIFELEGEAVRLRVLCPTFDYWVFFADRSRVCESVDLRQHEGSAPGRQL